MKRFISLLLCLVMLLTFFPSSVLAEGIDALAQAEKKQTAVSIDTNEEPGTDTADIGEDGAELTEELCELTMPRLGAALPEEKGSSKDGYGKLMYLSDYSLSEMPRHEVGWGTYTRDHDLDGYNISLWVNGEIYYFYKGVTAHAKADLIYDMGESYKDYDWFRAYIGVDSDRGSNGNVKFAFSASNDLKTWTRLYAPTTAFTGKTPAQKVELKITNYRYFRVEIDPNGANTADHAVLADACFVTEGYKAPTLTALKDGEQDMNEAYFENKLKSATPELIKTDTDTELNVLRYTLIKSCGFSNLTTFLTTSDTYLERIEAFTWLFNDLTALKDFMNGGIPAGGSYISAIDVLSDLYAVYKSDLNDETALRKGEDPTETRGDLYRRMMLTMSIVCANGLGAWLARAEVANPVNRYAYFKENYVNSKMRDEIFENLCVDEMRWVLGNNISDAEIVWLNDYARAHPRGGNQTSYPIIYSPHHHIAYQWYNYDKDQYYSEENRTYYTEKYMLKDYEKYGLVYGYNEDGTKVAQRVWQVFADGAVCGNISRTGANLAASFGVPACEVGQPGHAAFLIMNKGSNNQMTWGIDNNISGWNQSMNSRRMPCDWGNNSDTWNSGWRVPYVLLAQAALNDLDNYEKAEEILMLLPLCDNNSEREAVCRAALEVMPYHLDAWLAIVQMYVGDNAKTAKELSALAEELCKSEMHYYPKTLSDLMQLIFNRLTALGDANELARAKMLLKNALTDALSATAANTLQYDACRNIASYQLGQSDLTLATFSFDGDNAGSIVFSSSFSSVSFKLCIDGENWEGHYISELTNGRVCYKLTETELNSLSTANDIYIWLVGWAGEPSKAGAFKIDILAGSAVSGIERNDHENRFLGNVSGMEYSLDDGSTWAALTNDTLFPGNESVTVRKKANGTTLMGINTQYSFTEEDTDKRSYIPISRLSLAAFSSQQENQNDYAKYAIDGLLSTRWHNAWNGSDKQKFITIKTDKPTFITGLDYTPSSGNGTVYAGRVLVSIDGENWVTATSFSSWANNSNVKSVTFEPVYGQYVRFEVTSSVGNFVSARAIEIFEDLTLASKTVKGVELNNLPAKRDYVRGEALDLAGASARLVFNDNSKSVIPVSMLTSSVSVLTELGRQEVSLSYGSFAPTSFYVNVSERSFTPTSLSIVRLPDKTSFYEGDMVTAEGISLTATDGKTTVYLSENEYTLSANLSTAGESSVDVKMNGTDLKASYSVTVKKGISRIEITGEPEKTLYELGESFSTEGLEVTAVFKDSTREILDSSEYIFENTETFTEEAGDYDIPVLLADKQSIETSFKVTVYPYFTKDGIRYSVTEGHNCSVTSISCSESFMAIPESVRFGSTVYTVTGIAENVLEGAPCITELALPGTVTSIDAHAFDGSSSLKKLYLTAHTDFESLEVADSAFSEELEIALFAANDELKAELTSELADKPFTEALKVNNVSEEIVSLKLTEPYVTTLIRGEEPRWEGFKLEAVLNDGKAVPLDKSSCDISQVDTSTAGTKTVTVTLKTNENIKSSFSFTVRESTLKITKNPISALYTSHEAIIAPISVAAVSDGAQDVLLYQWYRSVTGAFDPDNDIIDGATDNTLIPDKKGFYYASAGIEGAELRVFSIMAEIDIGDYVATVGTKGYDNLSVAINEAAPGETVELLKNVTLSSTINISKNIIINGNGCSITRGQGFKGTMISLTGGTFKADDLTIDGGAGWYGDINPQTNRPCLSDNIAQSTIIRASGSSRLILGEVVLQNNYNMSEDTKNTTAGAIYAENTAYIELNGTTIRNNYSYLFGSAIYHRDNTTLVINDAEIYGNSGSERWNTTAICADNSSSCTINGGEFYSNVGYKKGDVIWAKNGMLEINGGNFHDNTCSEDCSSIYIDGSAAVTVKAAEEIGSVELFTTKTLTVGDGIPESGLSIKVNGVPENTEVVKLAEGADGAKLQELISINGRKVGINPAGNLIMPCNEHSKSSDKKLRTAATCTEGGEEYSYCTVCGAVINTYQTQPKGHSYKCSFTWRGYDCSADISCENCSFKYTAPCSVGNTVTKEPTVSSEGVRTYSASATYNGVTYTSQDNPTRSIPKLDDGGGTGGSTGGSTNFLSKIIEFIRNLFSKIFICC